VILVVQSIVAVPLGFGRQSLKSSHGPQETAGKRAGAAGDGFTMGVILMSFPDIGCINLKSACLIAGPCYGATAAGWSRDNAACVQSGVRPTRFRQRPSHSSRVATDPWAGSPRCSETKPAFGAIGRPSSCGVTAKGRAAFAAWQNRQAEQPSRLA